MAQGPNNSPAPPPPPSTRLIVKNLPKSMTVDKLRSVFSTHGEVTDVQLKYNLATKAFRGFGFVGFRTCEEAGRAQDYLNNTYIGAAKISVEPCVSLKDSTSFGKRKRTAGAGPSKEQDPQFSDSNQKPKKKKKEEELLDKIHQDPQFLEFLETHTQKKSAKWANDNVIQELQRSVGGSTKHSESQSKDLDPEPEPQPEEPESSKSKKKKKKKTKSSPVEVPVPELPSEPGADDADSGETKKKKKKRRRTKKFDSSINLWTIKLRDVPQKAKKKDIKTFLSPLVPVSIRFPPKFRGIAYASFSCPEDQAKALKTKNKSWCLGNKIRLHKVESEKAGAGGGESSTKKWTQQAQNLAQETESVNETGRIFLRNLPYTTNEDEIKELFSKFGPITEVHLPLDRLSRTIKGFGFISFMLPEQAAEAMAGLDGSIFQGRMLHLLPSKQAPEENNSESSDPLLKTSYKKAKDAERKKGSGQSHNWNSLFLGSNAVASVVSGKYGVSKEELLLDDGDGGVGRGGSGTSAAVRLALAETELVDETRNFLVENGVCLEAFEGTPTERSSKVFLVKNLPAGTLAQDLVDLYSKFGELGRIVLPPSGISAIIEFLEPAEARSAFKKTAYTNFHGVPLYLEWAPVGTFSGKSTTTGQPKSKATVLPSSRFDSFEDKPRGPAPVSLLELEFDQPVDLQVEDSKEDESVPKAPAQSDQTQSSKLLVRNVPFQAAQSEVLQLFKTFGEIKACRLPLKTDGSGDHRGFGFVEFFSPADSRRALETIGKSTHLYGRRLVIEYARESESVEQLRTKTARQFELQGTGNSGAGSSTKRQISRYFNSQLLGKNKGKAQGEGDEGDEEEADE